MKIKYLLPIGLASLSIILQSSFHFMVSAECKVTHTRLEWRELTENQKTAFIEAFKKLNEPNSRGESVIGYLTKIHTDYFKAHHIGASFFPWHRLLLFHMERALKRIDPDVILPYWDWSGPEDSQHPDQSEIWAYIGGNGDQNAPHCVTDGPFKDMIFTYPQPHCLTRLWGNKVGGNLGAFVALPVMANMIKNVKDYDGFRTYLEIAPHGKVHAEVGGEMMKFYSSNDIVFWLHHGFVDKIWSAFQNQGDKFFWSYNGIRSDKKPADINDKLEPYDTTVKRMMNISDLCYSYSNPDIFGSSMPQRRRRRRIKRSTTSNSNNNSNSHVTGWNRFKFGLANIVSKLIPERWKSKKTSSPPINSVGSPNIASSEDDSTPIPISSDATTTFAVNNGTTMNDAIVTANMKSESFSSMKHSTTTTTIIPNITFTEPPPRLIPPNPVSDAYLAMHQIPPEIAREYEKVIQTTYIEINKWMATEWEHARLPDVTQGVAKVWPNVQRQHQDSLEQLGLL